MDALNYGIYGPPTPHCWVSAPVALVTGETTFPLPLDREPDLMGVRLVNLVAENEWFPGDVIDGTSVTWGDGVTTEAAGFGLGYTKGGLTTALTNFFPAGLTLAINIGAGTLYAFKRATGSGSTRWAITPGSWLAKAYAIWFHP